MKIHTHIFLYSFFVFAICISASAQDRLRAGILYQPGEQIVAPMVGLTAIIPEGWGAILPQDTEMLLLMNQANPEGSIYAFGFDDTMEEIKSRLDIPLTVENNIQLVRTGELIQRGEVLGTELKVVGSTNQHRGYAEAKCGEFGWCVVYFLLSPPNLYDEFKQGLIDFMDKSILSEPTLGSIYDKFDWAVFLSQKYLATYISNPYVKKNNQVWFCPDGTFKSKIQEKGLGELSKDYRGSKSGTYEVKGTGQKGELILTFKKGEPVSVALEIKEDKIYVNGNRFYAMDNKECR